jgi:hypothetical protein
VFHSLPAIYKNIFNKKILDTSFPVKSLLDSHVSIAGIQFSVQIHNETIWFLQLSIIVLRIWFLVMFGMQSFVILFGFLLLSVQDPRHSETGFITVVEIIKGVVVGPNIHLP